MIVGAMKFIAPTYLLAITLEIYSDLHIERREFRH